MLRLGAFGVGRMGKVHVETLVRLHRERRIDLVALGDRHAETLRSAQALVRDLAGEAATGDLTLFGRPDAMAGSSLVDAVVIASRTSDHAADSLAFARAGIPSLVEKPLAGTIAESDSLCRTLGEAAGRLVQIGFQRHFDEPARLAARWVAQGRIGALQQTEHVLQDKNPTPRGYQSGGITTDMAIHLVYEAMSFRGFELPRTVQALRFMAPHYLDHAAEGANIVHVFCQWSDGSLAHLWGSRINRTGYDNGFRLIGTTGRIDVGEFVGDFGPVRVRRWERNDREADSRGELAESVEFPMTTPANRHPDFFPRFAAAFEAEIREFVARVEARTPLDPGPHVGWTTLLVANVAEASARRGGHRFELKRADGGPIATSADAARFAEAAAIE